MTFALAVIAGSLGALARYEVGGWAQRRSGSVRPWGTAAVNLTGALVLGLFVGVTTSQGSPGWVIATGFGFFGGYTTFSTWMVESVGLARDGREALRALYLNLIGLLLVGLGGLLAGLALGGYW